MQDQPLTNKTFVEFLEEFRKTNKLDTASNLLRTKYAREEVGKDNDKREKQLETINESMLEVKKAIETLSKNFTKQNDKVVKKLTDLEKASAQYNPLSNIKDTRPVTLKEGLKSGVASVKRFGSGIADLFTGKGKFAEARTPSGDIASIGSKFKAFGAGVKDIVGTSKDYTVEGGRFAEAFTKSPRGGLMQGKKTGFDVGLTKFNQMQAKEEEIKKLEEDIRISTRQGFEAPKGKAEELKNLKAEYAELDPRNKKAAIETKSNQSKESSSLSSIVASEESSSAYTPKDSFSEKLVKLTEKSLAELRKISKGITGAAAAAAAPVQAAGGGGGSGGGGSMIGDAASGAAGAATAGIGGKILGGLGTAAKVVGGALLSKPALIAGGVALAGYGAYKGYQAIKGAFGGGKEKETGGGENGEGAGGQDPSIEKAKSSKQAQALQKLNEEGKYNFEPSGRNVNVIDKETGELVRTIEAPDKISGADLMQAAGVGPTKREANREKAVKQFQAGQSQEEAAEQKMAKFVEENKPDSRKKQTPGQEFLEIPGAPLYNDPKKQAQYDALEKERVAGTRQKQEGRENYLKTDKAETNIAVRDGAGFRKNRRAELNKLTVLTTRFGYKEDDFIENGNTQTGKINAAYKKEMEKDLNTKRPSSSNAGISTKPSDSSSLASEQPPPAPQEDVDIEGSQPESLDDQIASKKSELSVQAKRSTSKSLEKVKTLNKELAELEAKKMSQSQVPATSAENAAMREEMAATQGTTTPIVANNVSNNNQTTYMPMKADPRPTHRGSALDRYNDRVAAY